MKTLCRLLLLLLPFVAVACTDDDETIAPSYVTEFGEVRTNSSGRVVTFTPDGGMSHMVSSNHTGLVADTAYRVLIRGLYEADDHLRITGLSRILSPKPRTMSEDKRKYDAAEVVALWPSQRYINMRLGLLTATGSHAFAFIEEGLDQLPNDVRRLRLHLYHDRGTNPEYYTREAYLSCPIYHYRDRLTAGRDSILFTITTYQGLHTLRMLYPEQ